MSPSTLPDVLARLDGIRERMSHAAERAGRDPQACTLIAVSKTHSALLVAQAIAAGAHDLGESRVQEAAEKVELLINDRARLRWHLIGHLQRNKAKLAVELFDLIHSLDSLRLAQTLARHVDELSVTGQRRLGVLLQFNVSGEASKEGFGLPGGVANTAQLQALLPTIAEIVALPTLEVRGLMTIAPWSPDPETARPIFRMLRELRDELARQFPQTEWGELSMGMTDDFEVAIEEGATLVRVGRAIFGER